MEKSVEKPVKSNRRIIEGVVVKRSGDKTVAVEVSTVSWHRSYAKKIARTKKYLAHDPKNEIEVGTNVKIIESRPLSRKKRWSVLYGA